MPAQLDNRGDFALEERMSANRQYGELDYAALLLQKMALSRGMDVLDVGCGNGVFTLEFKRTVGIGRVAGIDASATHIETGHRTAREAGLDVAFEVADAAALPYADAMFDRVCCSYALYHFDRIDRALNEMCRVVRRGGRLVLTGPTESNNKELYMLHSLGGNEVTATMGRGVFQSAVTEYFGAVDIHADFAEYINTIRFPSPQALIENYALTKLFLDNVPEAQRPETLSRLANVPWPAEFSEHKLTKTIGVFTVCV